MKYSLFFSLIFIQSFFAQAQNNAFISKSDQYFMLAEKLIDANQDIPKALRLIRKAKKQKNALVVMVYLLNFTR